MNSKRGITLVSLVVTIIVLIILAGLSINLTLGENGIITMAKRARENMELAKTDEERQLNELYEQIVTEGGSSGNISDDAIIRLAEFKRKIASAITDMGIETAENADASTMSSNIRSLIGASSADKVGYDNTNSELISTNVQGAVDELDSEIDELNNLNRNYIKLASSNETTATEKLVDDLTKYKEFVLYLGYSQNGNAINILASTNMSYELLKNMQGVTACYIASTNEVARVTVNYVSDTKVKLVTTNAQYVATLYGIK